MLTSSTTDSLPVDTTLSTIETNPTAEQLQLVSKPVNPFSSRQSVRLPTQISNPTTPFTVDTSTAYTALVSAINPSTSSTPPPLKICEECKNRIKPESVICCKSCRQLVVSKTDRILNKIRHNCVNLSIYHNRRYHTYKNILFSVFRVPLILLAGGNSFIAVGMQNYISQSNISIINALLSILCGIVTSIELLLNLQKRMEQELESYKNYYKLSIEIFRFIKLDPLDREEESKDFLPKIYETYEEYVTKGNAVNVYRRGFTDEFEDVNDDIIIPVVPDTWYNYFCHCCY
jgi:hypothetical protein